jgi:hypothetical protein
MFGMIPPKKCLDTYKSNNNLELDTSSRAYIGVRMDFALVKHAPSTKDALVIFVGCPILFADMLVSGTVDTLLLPFTSGGDAGARPSRSEEREKPKPDR